METRTHARTFCFAALGLAVLGGTAPTAWAGSAEEKFYKAFYLEEEMDDCKAAAVLYAQIVEDDDASRDLRQRAKARLAICHEEQMGADLARLMPPDTLVYAELRHPSRHVMGLLKQLGLLGEDGTVRSGELAVSPVLVRELFGVEGLALAITGFDFQKEQPKGVVVFHPGELEVVRGLLQTVLPVSGMPIDKVAGYDVYDVEGEALVALTARLVVVGTDREQIGKVLSRLEGRKQPSLADSPMMSAVADRRGDALVFFGVNAKAVMPMLKGKLKHEIPPDKLAMVETFLDPESFRSLTGQISVRDGSVFLDVALDLDEDHRNLAFNFLRTPPLNRDTFNCIPEGAAMFAVASLNLPSSRYSASSAGPSVAPVVTFLDIGREFFANITSLGVFVLPSEGAPKGPIPIPDVALVASVNDPAKSEALWQLVLGVASMAGGAPSIEGKPAGVTGQEVRTFSMPNGISVHFATAGQDVLISPSFSAISRAIEAKKNGRTVLKDKAYQQALSRISPDCTKTVMVHAGRIAKMASGFMPAGEAKQLEPFLPLLSDTSVSLVMEHGAHRLHAALEVGGIPDVSEFVNGMIRREQGEQTSRRKIAQASRTGNWQAALKEIDERLVDRPGHPELLRAKFDVLATAKMDVEAAARVGEQLAEALKDNANALNNIAWALLTEERYGGLYHKLAERMSERANQLTDNRNWAFLDTLALARFRCGDAESAVKLQKKAIEHSGGRAQAELQKRLSMYEEAVAGKND